MKVCFFKFPDVCVPVYLRGHVHNAQSCCQSIFSVPCFSHSPCESSLLGFVTVVRKQCTLKRQCQNNFLEFHADCASQLAVEKYTRMVITFQVTASHIRSKKRRKVRYWRVMPHVSFSEHWKLTKWCFLYLQLLFSACE